MGYRVPAPDERKSPDGRPIFVLPDDTLLRNLYKASYMTVGGMSIAYRATSGNRTYFIKEVEANDPERVTSLFQEKAILERLDHPGIVKFQDFFEQDGFYYIVEELIEGNSLEKLIPPEKGGFISESEIFGIAHELYDIFEYLHRQKPPIIYRDLKPHNILKDEKGHIRLVDFGIARIYKESRKDDTRMMGSAITASPEHFGGRQTDERSDIYTIGATLYFLLTNGSRKVAELFEYEPIRTINPDVSEGLEKLLIKALQREPQDRFQTIAEMRKAHQETGKNFGYDMSETGESLVEQAARSNAFGQGAFSEVSKDITGKSKASIYALAGLMLLFLALIAAGFSRVRHSLATATSTPRYTSGFSIVHTADDPLYKPDPRGPQQPVINPAAQPSGAPQMPATPSATESPAVLPTRIVYIMLDQMARPAPEPTVQDAPDLPAVDYPQGNPKTVSYNDHPAEKTPSDVEKTKGKKRSEGRGEESGGLAPRGSGEIESLIGFTSSLDGSELPGAQHDTSESSLKRIDRLMKVLKLASRKKLIEPPGLDVSGGTLFTGAKESFNIVIPHGYLLWCSKHNKDINFEEYLFVNIDIDVKDEKMDTLRIFDLFSIPSIAGLGRTGMTQLVSQLDETRGLSNVEVGSDTIGGETVDVVTAEGESYGYSHPFIRKWFKNRSTILIGPDGNYFILTASATPDYFREFDNREFTPMVNSMRFR